MINYLKKYLYVILFFAAALFCYRYNVQADTVFTEENWAAGDEEVFEEENISLFQNVQGTHISQYDFICRLMTKIGKGYSQSLRYTADYYDCSSLIQRTLKEAGVTGVPSTTSGWNSRLAGVKVGDIVTFEGTSKVSYRLTAVNINTTEHPELFEKTGTLAIYRSRKKQWTYSSNTWKI